MFSTEEFPNNPQFTIIQKTQLTPQGRPISVISEPDYLPENPRPYLPISPKLNQNPPTTKETTSCQEVCPTTTHGRFRGRQGQIFPECANA